VHLVSVAPRIGRIDTGDRWQRLRRVGDHLSHQAIDEPCLETQLFGVGDVLPGAAATRWIAALRSLGGFILRDPQWVRTEVWTPRNDAMRRRLKDVDEFAGQPAIVLSPTEPDSHTLARNREGDDDHAAAMVRDAVAGCVEPLDRDVEKLGVRCH